MMPDPITLMTDRLLLRAWRGADRDSYAAMNADPEVMEHFPSTLTREQSDAQVDRIKSRFSERGWGLWAVEVIDLAPDQMKVDFIGFVGLAIPLFKSHFTPCVEIGWRLARSAWGHGYATEAAKAVIHFAFEQLKLPEIVSVTASCNHRSQRVMQRLGMSHDPAENFDHPELPAGDRLCRHVLYRLRNPSSPPRVSDA